MSEVRLREEVQRITHAQQVMNEANAAITRGDNAALARLGFSPEHIDELRRPNVDGTLGFPEYVFVNNEMTLRVLESKLAALTDKKNRAPPRVSELLFASEMPPIATGL